MPLISSQNLSNIASICTIISSLSIVSAIFIYIKAKISENKKLDFSNLKKRKSYFELLAKEMVLIDKVVIKDKGFKNENLNLILGNRYRQTSNYKTEKRLKDGLRFILSDEAISSYPSFNTGMINNMDVILSRFCNLIIDRADFYDETSKRVDAWIKLKNNKDFIIKFPIPESLYNESIFNDIRFGKKTISGLGGEVIQNYFLPYLISYVSRNFENMSKDDTYSLLSSLWEIGPS